MRRDVIEYDEKRGTVEMRSLVVSDDIDAINAELRKQGKGFTTGGTMRRVANIDIDEYTGLLLSGDKDAKDFELSGRTDRNAFRRLLAKNPQWRCSEGGV